jgi:acyl-[acyl carrier protein]--UDP-N-acetylglucosamine O-acyltransferase
MQRRYMSRLLHLFNRTSEIKGKIGRNVKIGAHCFIGPNCSIGDNVVIQDNVRVLGRSIIGPYTKIAPFTSIGFQDDINQEENLGSIEIGANCDIGENVILNATQEKIEIGDSTNIGSSTHIKAANLQIKNNVEIQSNCYFDDASLIDEYAVIESNSQLLNSVRIGKRARITADSTLISKSIIPYSLVSGNPAKLDQLKIDEDVTKSTELMELIRFLNGKQISGLVGNYLTQLKLRNLQKRLEHLEKVVYSERLNLASKEEILEIITFLLDPNNSNPLLQTAPRQSLQLTQFCL